MNDQDYNTSVVNAVIAEAVKRPGWTQVRLAKALGVRPQTVNKWVSGENTPPHERWDEIETALGLTPRTFVRLVMGEDATSVLGLPAASEQLSLEDVRLSVDEVRLRLAAVELKLTQLLDRLEEQAPAPGRAESPSPRAARRGSRRS